MSKSTMENLFFKSLRSKQIAASLLRLLAICYNHFTCSLRRDKKIGHA